MKRAGRSSLWGGGTAAVWLVLLGASFVSGPGTAAIVCNPAAVAVTLEGLSVNFVTNITGTLKTEPAGWDISLFRGIAEPFVQGLYFFWPNRNGNFDNAGGVGNGDVYAALLAGTPVGPNNSYVLDGSGGTAEPYANWHVTHSDRYLGVRFFNEATSTTNYGWVHLVTGPNNGFPATMNGYCYENTGAAISAGATSTLGDLVFLDDFDL